MNETILELAKEYYGELETERLYKVFSDGSTFAVFKLDDGTIKILKEKGKEE